MKNFYTLLIFLAATCCSVAQTNYRNGYIITNNNDTIVGLIDYRTEAMLATSCSFKISISSSEQIFTPGQIAGFRFTDDGKFFVTREITIDDKKRTVFLEFLVQGIMNLYFFNDRQTSLSYYFFEDETGNIIKILKGKDTEFVRDGKSYKKADLNYRGVLKYIVKDVKPLWEVAENANYTHKDMINFTKNYHAQVCNTDAECIVFETKQENRFKLKYGIYAGWTPTFELYYHYQQDSYYNYYVIPRYNTGYSIGGLLNVSIPRFAKSLSVQMDACLTMLSSKFKQYDHSFFLFGTLSGKYTYHEGTIRPMVGIGATFGNLIGHDPFIYLDFNVSAGLNIKNINEHFIFCSIEYNTGAFTQLKVGYMF